MLTECEKCKKNVKYEEIISFSFGMWCNSCAKTTFYKCDECSERFSLNISGFSYKEAKKEAWIQKKNHVCSFLQEDNNDDEEIEIEQVDHEGNYEKIGTARWSAYRSSPQPYKEFVSSTSKETTENPIKRERRKEEIAKLLEKNRLLKEELMTMKYKMRQLEKELSKLRYEANIEIQSN